jgi:hypothetical protein
MRVRRFVSGASRAIRENERGKRGSVANVLEGIDAYKEQGATLVATLPRSTVACRYLRPTHFSVAKH